MLPLKALTSCRLINGLGEATQKGEDGWPRYVRTTDIKTPRRLRDDVRAAVAPEVAQRAMLQAGDLLLCSAGSLGSFLLFDGSEPACFAGYLTRFRPDPRRCEPRYAAYCVEDGWFREQVALGKVRSTIDNFSASKYAATRIPVPPTVELQRAIADFLDREFAAVREAAARGERAAEAIAASAEARAVETISSAASDAPKLKFLLKAPLAYGVLVPSPSDDENAVPLLRISDFDEFGRRTGTALMAISAKQSAEYARTVVQHGDVLLSVVGTIGRAALVTPELAAHNLSRALARIRPKPEVGSDLLRLILRSDIFKRFWQPIVYGSAQPVLNLGTLKEFSVPLPATAEERDTLHGRLLELESGTRATAKAAAALTERLAAYRESLIHEAVTGELDVSRLTERQMDERLHAATEDRLDEVTV